MTNHMPDQDETLELEQEAIEITLQLSQRYLELAASLREIELRY